jgi:hypothetical protein
MLLTISAGLCAGIYGQVSDPQRMGQASLSLKRRKGHFAKRIPKKTMNAIHAMLKRYNRAPPQTNKHPSLLPNHNPPTLLRLPLRFRIPLHHRPHPLHRDLLTRPVHSRNVAIFALTPSTRTRLHVLVILRADLADLSARAVDREVRPRGQIAVGGVASCAVCV